MDGSFLEVRRREDREYDDKEVEDANVEYEKVDSNEGTCVCIGLDIYRRMGMEDTTGGTSTVHGWHMILSAAVSAIEEKQHLVNVASPPAPAAAED